MRQLCIAIMALTAAAVGALSGTYANAAEARLAITLPQLNVAEYHPPYVAVWIEDERRQATQVAVWYDIALANGEGQEWLKDMRQWWRRGGRGLAMPVDGISGATHGPGEHYIDQQLTRALATLPDGKYTLLVEAAREVGGREVVKLPIELPLSAMQLPATASGNNEIESIALELTTNH